MDGGAEARAAAVSTSGSDRPPTTDVVGDDCTCSDPAGVRGRSPFCGLTSLPPIDALVDLRHLDLRGNPLTTLPSALATLPRLDKLDLRWVTTLPPDVEPTLAALAARGCLVYR